MARHRSWFMVAALAGALLLGALDCRNAAESGHAASIAPAELAKRMGTPAAPLILDVRSPSEYAAGHVPAAVNIPHTELAARMGELGIDKSDEVVVYCLGGKRAVQAERVLEEAGYTDVRHLAGQMRAWQGRGYPLE